MEMKGKLKEMKGKWKKMKGKWKENEMKMKGNERKSDREIKNSFFMWRKGSLRESPASPIKCYDVESFFYEKCKCFWVFFNKFTMTIQKKNCSTNAIFLDFPNCYPKLSTIFSFSKYSLPILKHKSLEIFIHRNFRLKGYLTPSQHSLSLPLLMIPSYRPLLRSYHHQEFL